MTAMIGFISVLFGLLEATNLDMRVLMGFFWLGCWVQKSESHYQGSMMGIRLSCVRLLFVKIYNQRSWDKEPNLLSLRLCVTSRW